MHKGHIVIVEDDDLLRESLCNFYTKNEYLVASFDSASGVYQYIQSYIDNQSDEVCIIVCDVMLPTEDGFSLIEQLKDFPNLGKIFISSKVDLKNRIKGLSLGADDYICKPFNSIELLLRTEGLLARLKATEIEIENENIQFLNFQLNPETRVLSCLSQHLKLGLVEHQLLIFLISKQGKVCSRYDIAKALNEEEKYQQGRALDILISRLRKKMYQLSQTDSIITYRGKGYLLVIN
jgi:DNA-binding response OmpR family regulator